MDNDEFWRSIGVGARKANMPMGPNQWREGMAPPTMTVNGREINLVRKETKTGVKHSKFEITISSNVRYTSLADNGKFGEAADVYNLRANEKNSSVENAIKSASDWLFSVSWRQNPAFLDMFDIWRGTRGNTVRTGQHPVFSDIASIDWEPGELEYGTSAKGRRIHYHGILSVYHYTQLRVNQKRCQSYINYMTTTHRNKYVWPVPSVRFISPYINGVYVNARSIIGNPELYNKKSLIKPYIEWLRRNQTSTSS